MGASTIVVARADLSIPGAVDAGNGYESGAGDVAARFFNIVRQHKPDLVVIDLTEPYGNGVPAIVKIRRQSTVPIVVLCRANDTLAWEYRLAGAAECMPAPLDILQLNATVQKIIQLAQGAEPRWVEPVLMQPASFAGLTLEPIITFCAPPTGRVSS